LFEDTFLPLIGERKACFNYEMEKLEVSILFLIIVVWMGFAIDYEINNGDC